MVASLVTSKRLTDRVPLTRSYYIRLSLIETLSCRKRIKFMLPPHPDEDEPITLLHLRSPSPPITAPYPAPELHHTSYKLAVLYREYSDPWRSTIILNPI